MLRRVLPALAQAKTGKITSHINHTRPSITPLRQPSTGTRVRITYLVWGSGVGAVWGSDVSITYLVWGSGVSITYLT